VNKSQTINQSIKSSFIDYSFDSVSVALEIYR